MLKDFEQSKTKMERQELQLQERRGRVEKASAIMTKIEALLTSD